MNAHDLVVWLAGGGIAVAYSTIRWARALERIALRRYRWWRFK